MIEVMETIVENEGRPLFDVFSSLREMYDGVSLDDPVSDVSRVVRSISFVAIGSLLSEAGREKRNSDAFARVANDLFSKSTTHD